MACAVDKAIPVGILSLFLLVICDSGSVYDLRRLLELEYMTKEIVDNLAFQVIVMSDQNEPDEPDENYDHYPIALFDILLGYAREKVEPQTIICVAAKYSRNESLVDHVIKSLSMDSTMVRSNKFKALWWAIIRLHYGIATKLLSHVKILTKDETHLAASALCDHDRQMGPAEGSYGLLPKRLALFTLITERMWRSSRSS